MDETADDSAINGNMDAADYDVLTDGIYASNQDPATALDNGIINNASAGTGTAPSGGTVTPPANGSSYTPPSWLSSLTNLASTAGNAATTLSPIINGKPAPSPSAAGQPAPAAGAKTVSVGGTSISTTTLAIGGAIALVLGFLLFKKK